VGPRGLDVGDTLYDDQIVKLVFDELMREPVFRAQATAAKAKGVDLLAKVREGMTQTDDILRDKATQFFAKHPEHRRAPYAVFLVYLPDTQEHEVHVHVGNAAITAARQSAAMQLVSGEVGLDVVDG